MDKETYEALKRIMDIVQDVRFAYTDSEEDVQKVMAWLDEVAKEYEPLSPPQTLHVCEPWDLNPGGYCRVCKQGRDYS